MKSLFRKTSLSLWSLSLIAILLACPHVKAGTVSVSLESSGTPAAFTEEALLYGNRTPTFKSYWETLSPAATETNLPYGNPATWPRTAVDATHFYTGAGVAVTDPGQASKVQRTGLTESQVDLADLRPDTLYTIVVYVVPQNFPQEYWVNGKTLTIPAENAPGRILSADRVQFTNVDSGLLGAISIATNSAGANIAGVQCQGIFPGGKKGPQADCVISKSTSKNTKLIGDRIFGNPRRQTLNLKTKGRRTQSCYVRIANEGHEYAEFILGGKWNPRHVRVTVKRDGNVGGIVTAAVQAKNYRFASAVDAGYKRFRVKIKPTKSIPRRGRKVQFISWPATRNAMKKDSVLCVLKRK